MRLGMTGYSYLFSPPQGMYSDRSTGYFDQKGFPAPYFLSTPVTIGPDFATEWQINRSAQLGLQVCQTDLPECDSARLASIKTLLDRRGIELVPWLGFNPFPGGQETKTSVDTAIRLINHYHNFGGISIVKICTLPMIHNRYRNAPPLDQQLELIVKHVKPIVKVAEDAGIVLALENHLDYYASEVVQIIEAVDSPAFKFLFDFGNAVVVIEDPVEAAKVAATYTVLAHMKDVRVLPWTPGALYVAAIYAAPLGRGNVDIKQICQILQEKTPDPKNLALVLEKMPGPPNEDEDLWAVESIKWAKENLKEFLNS